MIAETQRYKSGNRAYGSQGFMLRPSRALLVVSLGWCFLYVIAPIQTEIPVSKPGVLFLIIGFLLIWLGAVFGEKINLRSRRQCLLDVKLYTRIYWLALALGFVGISLRVFDWFFVRGLSYNTASLANRELLKEGSGSVISMLSLILVPLILYAFIVRVGLRRQGVFIGSQIDFLFCLAWPALNFVVGSRSAALITVFFLIFSILYSRVRMRFRHVLLGLGVFSLMLFATNFLLFARLEEMKVDYVEVAQSSGYTYFVPLSESFLNLLMGVEVSLGKMLFLVAHYMQYILHGVFEFSHLFENYDGSYAYGFYQFFYPMKVIGKIFGFPVDAEVVLDGVPRIGVYDTFFGAAFADFSYGSLLFGFTGGFICGRYWRKFERGDILSFPIYILLLFLVLLSPIVNGLLFSGGLFYIISFFVFRFFIRLRL